MSSSVLHSGSAWLAPRAVCHLAHLDAVVRHAAAGAVLRSPRHEDRARAPVAAGKATAGEVRVRGTEAGLDDRRRAVARSARRGARRIDAQDQAVGADRVRLLRLEAVDALVREGERRASVRAGRRASDGRAILGVTLVSVDHLHLNRLAGDRGVRAGELQRNARPKTGYPPRARPALRAPASGSRPCPRTCG